MLYFATCVQKVFPAMLVILILFHVMKVTIRIGVKQVVQDVHLVIFVQLNKQQSIKCFHKNVHLVLFVLLQLMRCLEVSEAILTKMIRQLLEETLVENITIVQKELHKKFLFLLLDMKLFWFKVLVI